MQFILEAITRRDNLVLLRFRTEGKECFIPFGEMCVWHGAEGTAAVAAEDLPEARQIYAPLRPAAEWGYSRILFDGIGLHSLAPQIYALLEDCPAAALSVSDIRLGILVPAGYADAVWLKLWAQYGAMLSADCQIKAPGQGE
ncbi:MAG: hypothetical protein IKY52_08700 [Clostridia bacterium]|nr:hypothetical protein [Clostridia bacterium]